MIVLLFCDSFALCASALLPNVFPPFPDRPEIDICAVMDPAREAGGDFYDFYLPDEDHLCLTKQVMDELHDAHTDGQNVLTMKKRL